MTAASEADAKWMIYFMVLKECSSCGAGVDLKTKKEKMCVELCGVFFWAFCCLVGFL